MCVCVVFAWPQILAGALLECHEEASKEGHRFALEVFQSGRNRLEDEGATALAQVFQVLQSVVIVFLPCLFLGLCREFDVCGNCMCHHRVGVPLLFEAFFYHKGGNFSQKKISTIKGEILVRKKFWHV